jgi:hypothetical protein
MRANGARSATGDTEFSAFRVLRGTRERGRREVRPRGHPAPLPPLARLERHKPHARVAGNPGQQDECLDFIARLALVLVAVAVPPDDTGHRDAFFEVVQSLAELDRITNVIDRGHDCQG